MKTLAHHNILVKPSIVHGYGVFATKNIPENTIIEECYCIFTEQNDPCLANFYFAHRNKYAIPTGFGFIYNHSLIPNADYCFDEAKKLMIITSAKHIQANEEIFISYGKNWFDARNLLVKRISFSQRFLNYLSGTPVRVVIAISGMVIAMYLMNVLTAIQQTQKSLENLAMTTQQEKGIEKPNLVASTLSHLSRLD
jgi:hypothetical protein